VLQGGKAIRYAVGVGREGFAWSGTAHVARRAEWPAWYPPREMIERAAAHNQFVPYRIDGGELNPLGARALYLYEGGRDTLYRIHGTNEPRSIGRNVSSGCIRLLNEDIVDLYGRIAIGTKVIVR
jgi:lipoprotein-anchoring transpeptidase ErfK/SrfK